MNTRKLDLFLYNHGKKAGLAIVAVLLLSSFGGCAPNFSDGERVGVVTKFSNKGLIWKSWEGSLNQGGTKMVSNGDGGSMVVANAIDFNVPDGPLTEKIKQAVNSGKPVKISYRQWFIAPIFIKSSRVVTSVSFID